jgi:RNA polymerase sigma-70 factor (ECF subfamily)
MELDILLDRALTGDGDAWNELLKRLRPIVRAFFRRRVRNNADASDLTQKVQIRMHQKFGQVRVKSVLQLLAWMRKLQAWVLCDFWRRKRLPFEPLPDLSDRNNIQPGSQLIRAEEMANLLEALERLPEHYRIVISMRLFDGLKCVEIAPILGQSPEWVRVIWKRAVEKLHKKLGIKP